LSDKIPEYEMSGVTALFNTLKSGKYGITLEIPGLPGEYREYWEILFQYGINVSNYSIR